MSSGESVDNIKGQICEEIANIGKRLQMSSQAEPHAQPALSTDTAADNLKAFGDIASSTGHQVLDHLANARDTLKDKADDFFEFVTSPTHDTAGQSSVVVSGVTADGDLLIGSIAVTDSQNFYDDHGDASSGRVSTVESETLQNFVVSGITSTGQPLVDGIFESMAVEGGAHEDSVIRESAEVATVSEASNDDAYRPDSIQPSAVTNGETVISSDQHPLEEFYPSVLSPVAESPSVQSPTPVKADTPAVQEGSPPRKQSSGEEEEEEEEDEAPPVRSSIIFSAKEEIEKQVGELAERTKSLLEPVTHVTEGSVDVDVHENTAEVEANNVPVGESDGISAENQNYQSTVLPTEFTSTEQSQVRLERELPDRIPDMHEHSGVAEGTEEIGKLATDGVVELPAEFVEVEGKDPSIATEGDLLGTFQNVSAGMIPDVQRRPEGTSDTTVVHATDEAPKPKDQAAEFLQHGHQQFGTAVQDASEHIHDAKTIALEKVQDVKENIVIASEPASAKAHAAKEAVVEKSHAAKEKVDAAVKQSVERAHQMESSAEVALAEAKDAVAEKGHDLQQKLSETVDQAKDKAHDIGENAKEMAQQTKDFGSKTGSRIAENLPEVPSFHAVSNDVSEKDEPPIAAKMSDSGVGAEAFGLTDDKQAFEKVSHELEDEIGKESARVAEELDVISFGSNEYTGNSPKQVTSPTPPPSKDTSESSLVAKATRDAHDKVQTAVASAENHSEEVKSEVKNTVATLRDEGRKLEESLPAVEVPKASKSNFDDIPMADDVEPLVTEELPKPAAPVAEEPKQTAVAKKGNNLRFTDRVRKMCSIL